MKTINELIIEQTNISYQLLTIKKKLDWVLNDPKRFKLRVKAQKKLIKFNKIQEEIKEIFNNIMK